MVWTPEQAGRFLDLAAEDRLYPVWHLIAYRGPWRGEVCGLDRSEFSRSRGSLEIRTSSDADEIDSEAVDGRLRHVAACLAYRATKDLKLVSQLMGHSGIQITADIYTTLFEEVDRAAAEAVAAIVPRCSATSLADQDETS